MKKDIYKWLVPLLLMFAFFALFLYGIYCKHVLYVQEFEAQIEIFGFYKEDVHVLDLYKENEICVFLFVTGFIGTLFHGLWLIFYFLDIKSHFSLNT